MSQLCVAALTIVAILLTAQGVTAKRGCSAFGHSCFGGHGKRSGDTALNEMSSQEMMAHRQLGQEETPPHPGYPHTFTGLQLPAGDDIIPVRDGGVYEHEDNPAGEAMRFKLRNIVKHWIDSYRRSQQNDAGYIMENM